MQVPLHCQTNNNNMDPLAVGFRNHHLFSFYCGELQVSPDGATSVDAAVGNGHHTLEATAYSADKFPFPRGFRFNFCLQGFWFFCSIGISNFVIIELSTDSV